MKIGLIGSGPVAQTIAAKLLQVGNEVMISSRNVSESKDRGQMGKYPSVNDWVGEQKARKFKAFGGSFREAAKFGEVLFNCTAGAASMEALDAAGKENLSGKVLVDVSNPLDFSKGMPPTLTVCNTESLGERIQKNFPQTRVVKTLNTVNMNLMVNPSLIPRDHDVFLCGNDAKAKEWVKETLLKKWFGWKSPIDLGDITSARGTEMSLPFWLRLMGSLQTPNFNIKVVKG